MSNTNKIVNYAEKYFERNKNIKERNKNIKESLILYNINVFLNFLLKRLETVDLNLNDIQPILEKYIRYYI